MPRYSIQLPMTPEQERIHAEIERLDVQLDAISRPLPVCTDDLALHRYGEEGCREVAGAEQKRLLVMRFALESRMVDLEAAKTERKA